MNYKVILIPRFISQVKRFIKKFPSLKNELLELEQSISLNPEQGTSLGYNTYKIRLAVKSKGRGKSGGVRVITYVVSKQNEIYLLSIYDKSEFSTISALELRELITSLGIK